MRRLSGPRCRPIRRIAVRVARNGKDAAVELATSVRGGRGVGRDGADAAEGRRREPQRISSRQRLQVPRVQALADGHAHLQLAQALIDRLRSAACSQADAISAS